jgi:putative ABC transport system ATP-binding protein
MTLSKDVLSFSNVHKFYKLGATQVHALKGISFDVQKGAFTTVIGSSGSGKSTLLNLAGTIDGPSSGDVHFQGQNIIHLSENQKSDLRNSQIGFVFQNFNLIPILSVYENVELPLLLRQDISKKNRKKKVAQILDDVGLTEQSIQLPDQLSGGQRQRVAIARALVGEPTLVIADEPTANLDSETTRKITDLLIDLNKKKHVTFLFSTHDEKLIRKVSKVVRIEDGQIVDT